MLGVIKRNFKHMDKNIFIGLYKSLVRSHLEYAEAVWSPYAVGLIEEVEKVQKRATKLVHGCNRLQYVDRLKYLSFPTLRFRRCRGDMIETFKILKKIYDEEAVPTLPLSSTEHTGGHQHKLLKRRVRYDLRQYFLRKEL